MNWTLNTWFRIVVYAVFFAVLQGLLGPLMLRCHISTVLLWCVIIMFATTMRHSGYHIPLMPSPQFHDYHHLTWVLYHIPFMPFPSFMTVITSREYSTASHSCLFPASWLLSSHVSTLPHPTHALTTVSWLPPSHVMTLAHLTFAHPLVPWILSTHVSTQPYLTHAFTQLHYYLDHIWVLCYLSFMPSSQITTASPEYSIKSHSCPHHTFMTTTTWMPNSCLHKSFMITTI